MLQGKGREYFECLGRQIYPETFRKIGNGFGKVNPI